MGAGQGEGELRPVSDSALLGTQASAYRRRYFVKPEPDKLGKEFQY
jgi:hypothetical protein